MAENFRRAKHACYYSYLSMSSAFCVPSILFATFHERYGISYTLLGTLILITFITQLGIDLVFSFFSKYFNVKKTVVLMPLLTSFGLLTYALLPMFFPEKAYLGLVIGTLLFSVAAGLSEVLISPIVAAIPSDNPDREMSRLHSLYAWGVLTMVIISTSFIRIFGTENWHYLVIFLAILPIGASVFFSAAKLPDLTFGSKENTNSAVKGSAFGVALCFACIFLGSSAENLMTTWISDFMEIALHISKNYCDILGIALFALVLGIVRSMYAKFGKNIMAFLIFGMLGSVFCYLISGFSNNIVVASVACVLTGAFTSMLWPGTLIMMEENMPALGVAAYALMAAGGDFGAGVLPQIMGIVTDKVSGTAFAAETANKLGTTVQAIGLRTGMVIGSIFPLAGFVLLLFIRKYFKKRKTV